MHNQGSKHGVLNTLPQTPESTREQALAGIQLDYPSDDQRPPKSRKPRRLVVALLACLGLIIIACVGSYAWYQQQLRAISADESAVAVRFVIEPGKTPSQIAQLLAEKELIRSALAFRVYTKISDTENRLQAGSYSISPTETTPGIVEHLTSGKIDEFNITFLPGATLKENRDALIKTGYSEAEVDGALEKTYNHPLLKDKPASANLEGYIYGETYRFSTSATVEEILERTFDEYYRAITNNKLEAGFKEQNLTLHQAIIMASIVQREVPGSADQKQVAQVFLKRYKEGMQLGSDITAYYGADLIGKKRAVTVDTPYNTRLHTGLPPGPIATPGLSALQAVAQPASGDYLYFLSGDDEVTYFARTGAEHDKNIVDHCAIKCAME